MHWCMHFRSLSRGFALNFSHKKESKFLLTALLWFQKMNAGGSGELFTTHVKFIVEPLSMYKSGAPIISVDGSVWMKKENELSFYT